MENNEVLIRVEGLSKKFCKDLKTSLWYGIKDLVSNIQGNKNDRLLRDKEFWAVKDINFELRRGECLGLIGHNGAGKSTLLKILNGLINPDAGKVTIKGRVGALIELGAGFNPILSGRENIYNNGAVLGFTKKEIDAKVEEIIDFAEIREFIDMPVQNYSSGMKVRLGFAVAAQMEPDVLIIDEVLAVGDVGFRAKCYERISELMKSCCIILVTHSMPQVSKICTKSILMHKGQIKAQGNNGDVIEAYYDDNFVEDKMTVIQSNNCKLDYFKTDKRQFNGEVRNFEIKLGIISEKDLENIELNLVIMSRELSPVCQGSSKFLKQDIRLKQGLNKFVFSIDNIYLNTGLYKFALTVDDCLSSKKYLWVQNLNPIKFINEFTGISPVMLSGKWDRND
ncbi:ABC transporter ATP-binding protein [Mariniflexile litorale]|uniref:ABC transporter ATP-binding protein n=1 Tax=Mariniflexile litorale TaxID=3045158 RepID=A0AAU7ECE7_9FLAO|nr:ABC transporter ATP-binding protein [Mariniflexile sp. KMM 9835]MDQ8212230.1 ABC transporter ATP-binding protein [Mariniflexile sp. KMM 9835]